MKGFFKWFKSGTKIKRWIFLMIIGIALVCYGMAKVLVTKELEFKELALIVAIFVAGFMFTIISIVCIQRRTLEMLVEETDIRDEESKVKTLIFNKKVYNQGPKIVVIGGGSGLNTVLKGVKNYTDNITAIVTISDYGIEDRKSKSSLEELPLGDIKESLIALSSNEPEMEKLLNINMSKGVTFGDIYLAAMKEAVGDFAKSIKESQKILNMTGKVIPATLDRISICAELEDGTVIDNKDKIPEIVGTHISKINRVYISPTNIRVAPGVLEAIAEADAIVIGPGSLYTNVIPNLLIPGISKAIRESKAFKIYVSNIMTEYGQTDNYSLYDHVKAIIDHSGNGIIDYCIYDTGEIVPEYIRQYNKEGSDLVEQDISRVKEKGIKLIQRNLSTIENGRIRHNPDAIATSIMELICDDLKFRDMQNDTSYIMLDSKIKNTKKQLKKNKNKTKKNRKNNEKHANSKFFEKYNDRIQSIQESGQKKNKINTKAKTQDSEYSKHMGKKNEQVKAENKSSLKPRKENQENYFNKEEKIQNMNFRLQEMSEFMKSKQKKEK